MTTCPTINPKTDTTEYDIPLRDALGRSELTDVLSAAVRASEARRPFPTASAVAFYTGISVLAVLLLAGIGLLLLTLAHQVDYLTAGAGAFAICSAFGLTIVITAFALAQIIRRRRIASQTIEHGCTMPSSDNVPFEKQWFGARPRLCDRFTAFCESKSISRDDATEYLIRVLWTLGIAASEDSKWINADVALDIGDRRRHVPVSSGESQVSHDTSASYPPQNNRGGTIRGGAVERIGHYLTDFAFSILGRVIRFVVSLIFAAAFFWFLFRLFHQ